MDQLVEGKSPYEIMGVERSSTQQEIKKAWNKLVLVKHPDKAKTPNAAEEFDQLKKAYAILSDKSARGALDDYLEAAAHREQRLAQQDAKRQRMREDLERRERETGRARNEEEQARARLQVELEALRARAQQEQADKQQQAAAAAAAAASRGGVDLSGRQQAPSTAVQAGGADGAGGYDAYDDNATELLRRTVKASWDPAVGHYSTEQLRELFGRKFIVEDVIMKDSSSSSSKSKSKKKKQKASALVVLDSIEAACQAAHEVHGNLKNPLLVTPYLKVMPDAAGAQNKQQQREVAAGSEQQRSAAATGDADDGGSGSIRRPAAPLFAAGAGSGSPASRPVQRPSKPLFPGAQPGVASPAAAGSTTATGTTAGGGAAKAGFSSFPSMPAASGDGSKPFSSFPGMPSTGSAAAGRFEDSVLKRLQQQSSSRS